MTTINWHQMFVPSGNIVELIARGSVMYLSLLGALRIFRRNSGSLAFSDLLVIVLIADAAQNGMAGEYKSLTEGVVLCATIFVWSYLLDWLSYHSRFVSWLLHPPPVVLVREGRPDEEQLRKLLITHEDLLEQLRLQGVEAPRLVKQCRLEADGKMSVIAFSQEREHREAEGAGQT